MGRFWLGFRVRTPQSAYLYMPRLANFGVLAAAISDGVAQLNWVEDSFAFAESYDDTAHRYRGMKVGEHVGVGMSQDAVLVQPARASVQLDAEAAETDEDVAPGAEEDVAEGDDGTQSADSAPTRFYARKLLDPVRAIRDFGDLINEVAAHLGNADGSKVTITVEINAESEAFDDRTRRTVSENATQLGFDAHEFEA